MFYQKKKTTQFVTVSVNDFKKSNPEQYFISLTGKEKVKIYLLFRIKESLVFLLVIVLQCCH